MSTSKIPKITVLMPVYNCELFVKNSLDSILNQTYRDFELLIIDDASTDSTVTIIKEYNDSRIQLIEKTENSGYTNSLNFGLRIAKGEYIARMDGDDISFPERFERQVAFLDVNLEVVVCGSMFNIIGTETIVQVPETHDNIKLQMLSNCCIGHPTVMIRKKILDNFALVYDIEKEPAEDYDLWTKLSLVGKLHNLQEVLLSYRIHDSQVSQKRINQQIKNSLEIKLNLLNIIGFESNLEEQDFIKKIFAMNESFSFYELKQFQILKDKLIRANQANFFDREGFSNLFLKIEYRIFKDYFFKRKSNYTPIIWFQYSKMKNSTYFKLTPINQIKLFIKSFIFYKVS